MNVKVELQAYLQQYSPNGKGTFDLEMPPGSTVGDLVTKLGVPSDLTSFIIVDQIPVDSDAQLAADNHVILVPPLAGG